MSSDDRPGLVVLARSPGYRVERGECGMIHVHAGPVTMHMGQQACESFTTVLAKAMVELVALRARETPPEPHLTLVANDDGPPASRETSDSTSSAQGQGS